MYIIYTYRRGFAAGLKSKQIIAACDSLELKPLALCIYIVKMLWHKGFYCTLDFSGLSGKPECELQLMPTCLHALICSSELAPPGA